MLPVKFSVVMPIHQFYPLIGGAEQQAQRLAGNLARRGHLVTVLTGRWSSQLPKSEIIDGIYVYRNGTLWKSLEKMGWLITLRQYAYEATLLWFLWRQRKSYHLIHVHQALHAAAFSTFAAKCLGKKIVIKVGCGGVLSDLNMMKGCRVSPFGKQLWSIIKKCDRIIAINHEIEEELLNDGFTRRQVVKIPNGISMVGITVKESYTIHQPVRLVSVGRLDRQKGFDVLIDALALYFPRPFTCEIFGEGNEYARLTQQIKDRDLSERVNLRGIVDTPSRLFHDLDMFVLVSRAEGLSNALLEAMISGLPCIASNIGGNSDLLSPDNITLSIPAGEYHVGMNGILVNVDDLVGLLKAIDYLASDEAVRERLGRCGREWVIEHCSLDAVTDQYLSLYSELLAEQSVALC